MLQIQITKINLECEKATKKYEKKLAIVNELKSKIIIITKKGKKNENKKNTKRN